jgi:hypothetical protein
VSRKEERRSFFLKERRSYEVREVREVMKLEKMKKEINTGMNDMFVHIPSLTGRVVVGLSYFYKHVVPNGTRRNPSHLRFDDLRFTCLNYDSND